MSTARSRTRGSNLVTLPETDAYLASVLDEIADWADGNTNWETWPIVLREAAKRLRGAGLHEGEGK